MDDTQLPPWIASAVAGVGRNLGSAVAGGFVSLGLMAASGQEYSTTINIVGGAVGLAATILWTVIQKRRAAKRIATAQVSSAPAAAAPSVPF